MVRKVYDKDSEAFYCCCGCMHVTTGAIIVCMLQILYIIAFSVLACWAVDFKLDVLAIVFLVLIGIVLLAVYVTPMIGICAKTAGWLWPYIIVNILHIILAFGFMVASLVGLCLDLNGMNLIIGINTFSFKEPDPLIPEPDIYYWLAYFAAKNLADLVFGAWFLMIVWNCKSYLRDVENDLIFSSRMMTTAPNNENNQTTGAAPADIENQKDKKNKNKKDKEKKKEKDKEKDNKSNKKDKKKKKKEKTETEDE